MVHKNKIALTTVLLFTVFEKAQHKMLLLKTSWDTKTYYPVKGTAYFEQRREN